MCRVNIVFLIDDEKEEDVGMYLILMVLWPSRKNMAYQERYQASLIYVGLKLWSHMDGTSSSYLAIQ